MMTFLLSLPFLYGALIISIILIAVFVELEIARWATTVTTAAIVFIGWNFWQETQDFLFSNPLNTLMYAGGYILVGVLWSILKWKRYISHSVNKFKKIKKEFLSNHKDIGSNWEKWISHLNKSYPSGYGSSGFYETSTPEDIIKKVTVDASEKKGAIVSWISFWPMSLAATFLNDPFKKFFSWIFDLISGVYDRMAKNSVKGLSDGMEKSILAPVEEDEEER